MELGYLIFFYYLHCICKVSICLTGESDDEVSTDIELDAVSSLYISEFCEDFSQTNPIVVTVHRLQYIRRARLDREVCVCHDTRMCEECYEFITTELDTE